MKALVCIECGKRIGDDDGNWINTHSVTGDEEYLCDVCFKEFKETN